MLPIVDDLERALAAEAGEAPAESYRRGVELIHADSRPAHAARREADRRPSARLRSEPPPGRGHRNPCPACPTARLSRSCGAGTCSATGSFGRDGEGGEGVSKRDYYEVLGVARHGRRVGNEVCLPEARAAAPSGSQSRRQERGRTVQGSGRGLRGALGYRRSARVYDRFGHAGVGGGQRRVRSVHVSPASKTSSADSATSSAWAIIFGGGRRRGGPQRGSAPALRPRDQFEEAARGHRDVACSSRAPRAARLPRLGRRDRIRPHHVPDVPGARTAAVSAGLLHRRAHVQSVPRARAQIIAKPCAACHGEGRVQKERKLTVRIPAGIDTGQRLRIQGEGEPACRAAPRGSLRRRAGAGPRVLPPRGQRPLLRDAAALPDARARRRDQGRDAGRRAGAAEGARRHRDGDDVPSARQRHARRRGPRKGDLLVTVQATTRRS